MPRISRKNLNGNFFHIMVQGIEKKMIFNENHWKEKYKEFLKEATKKINIKVIAYCIMGNHVHLLIYTNDIKQMTKLMQIVNANYARYYNYINKRVGYVYRDRYKVQEIKNLKHLYACFKYIHKNPVKARIVDSELKYHYSSYSEYLGKHELITDESIKCIFSTSNKKEYLELFYRIHQTEYSNNVKDIDDNDYIEIVKEWTDRGLKNETIAKRLKEQYNLSERKIIIIMGTTRYYLRKLLKKSDNLK